MHRFIRALGHLLIFGCVAFSIILYQLEREVLQSSLPDSFKYFLAIPAQLEKSFYDKRMFYTLSHKSSSSPQILAAIDEESLKKIGRWPWGREVWATLIEKFSQLEAKVVALDVMFPEPEKYLSCSKETQSPDMAFAKSIEAFQKKGGRLILPYSLVSSPAPEGSITLKETPSELYEFMLDVTAHKEGHFSPQEVMATTFPIPELLKASPALSFIGSQEDSDGIFRHYPLVASIEGMIYPSFALQAFLLLKNEKMKLEIDRFSNGKINYQGQILEISPLGETAIRFSGGVFYFNKISLGEIYMASPKELLAIKKKIQGKLVFVGSTAYAAHDLRHTPIDPKLPGIYFHMNMVEMFLKNFFYKPLAESLQWSWLLLLGTLIIIWITALFKNLFVDVFILLSLTLFLTLFDIYYTLPQGHRLALFFIYMALFASALWNIFLNFYLANKDKRFLKQAFGSYISPELIKIMQDKGEKPSLGGEALVLTAFFTDIQGFSTFSEKLTPIKLVELLNEYLSAMTDILLREKGTLDKYEGDAIIAFFGAPLPLSDHAINAAKVALEMQKTLATLREKWKGEGDKWPSIVHEMRMRIGLNSGEMVVGNMGSKVRMNYTMMGDAVNLAARLEAAAKQYGIYIHASEATKDLSGDQFEWRELDLIRVVGKSLPVRTFELIGEKGHLTEKQQNLSRTFREALDLFKKREWEKALLLFEKAQTFEESEKKSPSLIYQERCQFFVKNPPEKEWDGVFTLTSK